MSEDSKKPSGRVRKSQNPPQGETLKIEVNKYKSIADALSGERWWRTLFSVFIFGCVLFTGIATVALAIKRMYPYSDITTNGLGATTFKSENSEVSYWLYNTALLWANSGISVEKGDVITVRSSGKFNTAMHHLYKSAKENTPMQEEWTGPEGEPDDPADRTGSYYRRKYRIFPGMPTGALVMQVARNEPFDTPSDPMDNKHQSLPNPDDFFFIGGEREDIYINNPGTLYFGINDIVFNKKTIAGMLVESIEDFVDGKTGYNDEARDERVKQAKSDLNSYKTGHSADPYAPEAMSLLFQAYRTAYKVDFDYLDKDRSLYIDALEKDENKLIDISKKGGEVLQGKIAQRLDCNALPSRIKDTIQEFSFAIYSDKNIEEAFNALIKELRSNRAIGKMRLGVTRVSHEEVVSELETYYNKGDNVYKTAWFDDNVGSFLIVVEKKTK